MTTIEYINAVDEAIPGIIVLPGVILLEGNFNNDISDAVIFGTNGESGSG